MRLPLIAAAAVLAYTAWEWSRQQSEAGQESEDQSFGFVTEAYNEALSIVGEWSEMVTGYSINKVPLQYRSAIAQAEQANGIPDGMLARLLWQESRYRPEIIDGRKRSPVGAMGIAQFMPATAREMGIDPLEPFQAIAAAGRYLGGLYRQTGDWAAALAAYNWGIGNVKRKGLDAAPRETRNYFSQILADLGMANA